MTSLHYIFYQCKNPSCGLRFPAQAGSLGAAVCPRCKAQIEQADSLLIKQDADDRTWESSSLVIEALFDNIRSAWNVGSMFRTADGTRISRVYLCGITPTPIHPQVRRTGLGAETALPWHYISNAVDLAQSLVSDGKRLWVLETTTDSTNLFDIKIDARSQPVILVVGNEICGVDPRLLELSERVISIPMVGMKKSYNVAVAFGIAASYLRYCQIFSQESTRIFPNT